ncbi:MULTISPECIES: hypothetical protein [Nitrosomonas]|uniref:hypothetical protein n=1 Tax=Nitrosomonas TaxID=914 RepID=UPI0011876EDF|nr:MULTISPECIES: hypothetical protein [Nitrosomonas]UVS60201.1 hypothetical protein NX761_11820 [Nitrosomonas sp. PLL12]
MLIYYYVRQSFSVVRSIPKQAARQQNCDIFFLPHPYLGISTPGCPVTGNHIIPYYFSKREPENRKALSHVMTKCPILLVAKGGIEPPTQGFSVSKNNHLSLLIVIQ